MLEVLWAAGSFVVAVGILVAFHEWGHFWTARKLGVQVLRYSIGFGRPLWRRQGADGTEYVVAAIPLGGYVKMLDEREAEVDPAMRHRAFNVQPPWKRILIVLAGPAANFLFAIVAYWAIFVAGTPGLKPVLGEPPVGSLAHRVGLLADDEILRVGDSPIATWDVLRPELLDLALAGEPVVLALRRGADRVQVTMDFAGISADPQQLYAEVGMYPPQPHYRPILGEIVAGEAAASAGLQAGDRILSAAGERMDSWMQWRDWLRERPLETVELRVLRADKELTVSLQIGERFEDGLRVGRLGASVAAQPELWQDLQLTYRLTPWAAVPAALVRTWDMSRLTLQMLGRMVIGEVSVRNVSGPLHIAQYAGSTAAAGIIAFLSFLAIISVSLGVLNLLPVPVLDGGHLLYYLVEVVKGSPVSEQVQVVGQQIGIAALVLLMGVAFYNDILRLVS